MSVARKELIISEKPSAARAIAEALGGFSGREGYLESREYYLSWAIGHLVELMSPEEYEPKWKRWSLDSLPIDPAAFELRVVNKTRAQFQVLTRLAGQASALINACDAGREGELIFRYICRAGNLRLPTRRLWVSALTRDAIQQGFSALRSEADFDRLYQSALCRAQGDWLVGMNGTRAFTVRWGELLSVGRVQTPTLAMLVRREREIEQFVPEAFWEVFAEFALPEGRGYRGKWFEGDKERLTEAQQAAAVADRVRGRTGTVECAASKPVAERPPQLHDLTQLQRDANRRYGFTAAATLKAAQSLYEKKLITYPRTDSRHLARALVKGLPAVVKALGGLAEFRAAAAGADLTLVHPGNRRVVDDAKVTDHHAIIPTAEAKGGLSGTEAKIFGLIARRFLAQFYPEAQFLETEVITAVAGPEAVDRFRTRGRQLLQPGWRAVEQEAPRSRKDQSGEPEVTLPPIAEGECPVVTTSEVAAKETQPPRRFTEATLLSAMEFAGREMDDDALKEAMKGHGLGTPATRAAIIERLKDVGYIQSEKKALVPTEKGRNLVRLAEQAGAHVLLNAELTGAWEKRIADIQAGAYEPIRFMQEVRELAHQVVGWARSLSLPRQGAAGQGRRRSAESRTGDESADALPSFGGKCPRCQRAVTKGSRDWVCANPECTVRLPGFLCGKVIGAELAAALLERGRTPLITGFKSARTGKAFSAFLLFREGKVEFEFPPNRAGARSGYRRAGGKPVESATAAKTGSRKAGGGAGSATGGDAKSRRGGAGSAGMGRRSSRAPQSARTESGRS